MIALVAASIASSRLIPALAVTAALLSAAYAVVVGRAQARAAKATAARAESSTNCAGL